MKKFLLFIDSLLKSVKFAVILMLLIGAASIYGTIYPAKTPFDFNLYKTVPFTALLFLFAVNVAYCTAFRLVKQVKARRSDFKGGKEVVTVDKGDFFLERLKEAGFKTEDRGEYIYAVRGWNRLTVILIIHIAIVLLLTGAGLSSLTGFIGTANVHVNDKLSQCFDWEKKKDVPLPFDIVVDRAEIIYYPMPIKVLVQDMLSNESSLIVTKELEKITFGSHSFKITKADPATGKMTIYLIREGREEGPFENIVTGDNRQFKFTLKAYIDPTPRQYVAEVAIFENRIQKVSKRISINDPLIYRGYRIYLLNIDKDEFNFPYVGFQITKEPFLWLIWFSSILLCLSLFVYPFLKEYRLILVKNGERLIVYSNDETVKDLLI